MTEQTKVIEPWPDPIALSMSGALKAHVGLTGSPLAADIQRLEQLGVAIPPYCGPADLKRLIADAERKQVLPGDSRSDRLTQRWHDVWNRYVALLPVARRLGLPSERKIEPIAHSHTAAQVEELQRVHDELSHEIAVQEAMTPGERRIVRLERKDSQQDQMFKVLCAEFNKIEKTVVALAECCTELMKHVPIPTANALAARIRLVVDNTPSGDAA
jgi:hypothetical protein